jgi:hypothetical protein
MKIIFQQMLISSARLAPLGEDCVGAAPDSEPEEPEVEADDGTVGEGLEPPLAGPVPDAAAVPEAVDPVVKVVDATDSEPLAVEELEEPVASGKGEIKMI